MTETLAADQGEIRRDRPHWAQLPEPLLLDQTVSHLAVRTYALLDRYADSERGCFPGQDTLADRLGVSRGTVNRAIGELKAKGWLTVRRRRNASNLYVVHTSACAPERAPDVADIAQPVARQSAQEPEPENQITPSGARARQGAHGPEEGGGSSPAERMQMAALLLAQAEARRRGAEINDAGAYIRARQRTILAEHEALWTLCLEQDPTSTAPDLAEAATPTNRGPLDATVEAQQRTFERHAQEAADQPGRDPEANEAGLAAAREQAKRGRK